MLLFNELVFDEFVDQPAGFWFQNGVWDHVQGTVETLAFHVVASEVQGIAPDLYIDLYETAALELEEQSGLKNLFNHVPLSTTDTNVLTATYSVQDAVFPPSNGLFFIIALG